MRFLSLLLTAAVVAQTPNTPTPTFAITTNVVVVDVTVSARDGSPITNLAKDDFLLYEDGKQQRLLSCDLQKLESKGQRSPGVRKGGGS